MRILHVITALPSGGAEMMLLRLLSFTKENHTQAVVCLKDEGTVGPHIKELGVQLYTLNLRPSAPNPLRALSLRSLTRQFRPQLIQGWMYHGNLMASFAAGWSADHTPVIWGIHWSVYDLKTERRPTAAVIRLGAIFSHRAASIVYVSRASRAQHEALGYHSASGLVIPNGIDCHMFHPDVQARQQVRAELGLTDENILIGLIARYHPMKDHAGFLRAASVAARKHPGARFVLIGRGVTREEPVLRNIIAAGPLQDRIFFLGERSDIPRLTAALDISCSSSISEAFSVAIAEAMACRVPCVVTDVGDNAYLVGDTGIAVPPREPEMLAQAINRLIDAGAAHRRQLGEAARRRIEAEFSLPEVARRYEDLYRQHSSPAQE